MVNANKRKILCTIFYLYNKSEGGMFYGDYYAVTGMGHFFPPAPESK